MGPAPSRIHGMTGASLRITVTADASITLMDLLHEAATP